MFKILYARWSLPFLEYPRTTESPRLQLVVIPRHYDITARKEIGIPCSKVEAEPIVYLTHLLNDLPLDMCLTASNSNMYSTKL